ncbi:MAG: lipoyl(octanoyl) transferase [Flavobacteriales bacterium]|nr:lipoyl(octanoyl) transferase [Flavobacteriales bacterium]
MNKQVNLIHKGLIDYKECWDYQTSIFDEIIEQKILIRKGLAKEKETQNFLIFCEHPHVYTLGKTGEKSNLLIDENVLKSKGVNYYHINRGGDITYHGPGQIVGYPILDLDNFFTDINTYLRYLEESVILTLRDYGIDSMRLKGATGVWIDGDNPLKARKICAIGVKLSRWVTMHGFAFNVNTDLEYFNHIVPCGIKNKEVTSLEKELGVKQDLIEVQNKLLFHLSNLFGFQFI